MARSTRRAAQPAIAAAAAIAGAAGTATQRRDLAAAVQTSRGSEPSKRQPVRRTAPAVGRNEPCPCGSGKKYKHCHGKRT